VAEGSLTGRDRERAPTPGTMSRPRPFASVRTRLAAIGALAALPVLLLAITIATQNYAMVRGQSVTEVRLLREAAVARHQAAMGAASHLLSVLARDPALLQNPPAPCREELQRALHFVELDMRDLAVFDASGRLRCSVRATEIPPPPAGPARAGRLSIGPLGEGGGDVPVLPVYVRTADGGSVAAELYVTWFTAARSEPSFSPLAAVWLRDAGGRLMAFGAARPADLPGAGAAPAADPAPHLGRSSSGQDFAYAGADLGQGLHLLVGFPAQEADLRAARVLRDHMLQLLLLLVLAPAAVALGAEVGLAAPLRRLATGVARWRMDGNFDQELTRCGPTELRELATTFAIATQDLAAQEAKLAAAQHRQTLLMKEIHHRVKNNLQIVASLLNLQAARIRAPEAKSEFASARDRVRALATLHRHLYTTDENAPDDVHMIAMPAFLRELCEQLFQTMGEREGRRIALDIDAGGIEMPSDQAVPIALIVTEMVSNSLKYAFPPPRRGTISVRLGNNDGWLELAIADDGVGLPPAKPDAADPERRTGLGMQLVRGFARQLGAEITLSETHGTRLLLRLRAAGRSGITPS
jgi:two-component sensor histidine kinase